MSQNALQDEMRARIQDGGHVSRDAGRRDMRVRYGRRTKTDALQDTPKANQLPP